MSLWIAGETDIWSIFTEILKPYKILIKKLSIEILKISSKTLNINSMWVLILYTHIFYNFLE